MKTVNEIMATMEKDGPAEEARSKLLCSELQELYESKEDLYYVLLHAYQLGYYRGTQAE